MIWLQLRHFLSTAGNSAHVDYQYEAALNSEPYTKEVAHTLIYISPNSPVFLF